MTAMTLPVIDQVSMPLGVSKKGGETERDLRLLEGGFDGQRKSRLSFSTCIMLDTSRSPSDKDSHY